MGFWAAGLQSAARWPRPERQKCPWLGWPITFAQLSVENPGNEHTEKQSVSIHVAQSTNLNLWSIVGFTQTLWHSAERKVYFNLTLYDFDIQSSQLCSEEHYFKIVSLFCIQLLQTLPIFTSTSLNPVLLLICCHLTYYCTVFAKSSSSWILLIPLTFTVVLLLFSLFKICSCHKFQNDLFHFFVRMVQLFSRRKYATAAYFFVFSISRQFH